MSCPFCLTPQVRGYRPVKNAARLGAHTGETEYALSISTPSRASRSIFGVRTKAFPVHPRVS